MWLAPSLRLKWGPYFKSDPGEQKETVTLVQAARGKGPGLVGAEPLITKRQAVEMLAPVFGIENVDAIMTELEKETAEADKKMADQAAAQAKADAEQVTHLHKLANDLNDDGPKQSGAGASGGKDKKAPGDGGSGGAATASKEA